MKKICNLILIACIYLGVFSLQQYTLIVKKVVYETPHQNRIATLEDVEGEFTETNEVRLLVQFDYDVEQVTVQPLSEFDDETTMEEINQYRMEQRNHCKQYFTAQNQAYFQTLNLKNYQSVYLSKYAPYMELILDKEEFLKNDINVLERISSNRYVETIYVQNPETVKKEQLEYAMPETGAAKYYNTRSLAGRGVVVGLLEGNGMVDFSNSNFVGTDYLVYDRPYLEETPSLHATIMGSLLGGKEGVASKAKILSAGISYSVFDEIDWMVENGADIINMSYVQEPVDGCYGGETSYIDYIAKYYSILCVAAVGNAGNGSYVGNPALGYNIIGVGSIDYNRQLSTFSATEVMAGPYKPTLVAPGENLSVSNFSMGVSGTSGSAAIVSGIAALLFEKYPVLKTKMAQTHAMMITYTTLLEGYGKNLPNGLNSSVGAGLINLDDMIELYGMSIEIVRNLPNGYTVYWFDAYLMPGDLLRVGIAWLGSSKDGTMRYTDYDLRVYDPKNNLIAQSSTNSNIEYVQLPITKEGSYSMRICITSDREDGPDPVGFAYQFRA